MDDLDKRIISALQQDFPIAQRPYDSIAENLGLSVDVLLERTRKLLADGMIRRIGFSLDSRKLGYKSTLAAVRIPSDQVPTAASIMADIPEITHSYERADEFNVWFTVIAPARNDIEYILKKIKDALNLSDADILDLPASRLFKLDARFSPQTEEDCND
ncbi:Lrp/AsnC family transcriptional regulator [Anaerohalosphaera lusitana]|uniref:Lrp/AsnC family transcriptional regulator n=1 Tax=Anaerohalosphaera lusitana TaxID=1936003 RepID=UPI001473BC75|nr:AsnC family transcriptional regulator [Anaerohalosphaera lusitana]